MRPHYVDWSGTWIDLDHVLAIDDLEIEDGQWRGPDGVVVRLTMAFRDKPLDLRCSLDYEVNWGELTDSERELTSGLSGEALTSVYDKLTAAASARATEANREACGRAVACFKNGPYEELLRAWRGDQ